jgi:trimeric autotransporter adhesin
MRNAFTRNAGRLLLLPVATLVASAVAGCGGDRARDGGPLAPGASPEAAPASAPSLEIQDARNAGAPGFYFLPPIAAALASWPGTFDAARSPTVEVCRWSGTACAGPVVATYSRAAGTIAVDVANQLYRANWPTAGLAPGVLYRVRVLEAGAELGHADAQVPGPGETGTTLAARGIVPLGNAPSLAVRFRLERNGAPAVTITAPPDGAVVPSGTPLALTATATDPEQGDLTAQIVWRSNRVVGDLGTGGSITRTLGGGRHVLTASVTDASGATASASVEVVVSIVSVPPTLNVPYGGTASLPITLSEPAPAGGLTFAVSSGTPGAVGVATATVTIPAGQQSGNATLQGAAPGTSTVTVTNADYGSASSQVSTTANLNIAESSVSFAAGRPQTITVELESAGADIAAPPGGLQVTLTSANPACVAATSPITIPAGLVSVTATLTYGGSAATPCATLVTASVPSIPSIAGDQVSATVNPSPTIALNVGGAAVGSGLVYGAYNVSLAAAAPTGGVTVTLTSSNPALLQLSATETGTGAGTLALPIAGGTSNATFWIQGVEGATGTATVMASAPGYASTTSTGVAVRPAIIDLVGLPANVPVTAADDPFQVRVGVANAALTGVQTEQSARAGNAITVGVANGTAAVAELELAGGPAQSGTVTIAVGQARSPVAVAGGGVAFDPLGGGTTTVTATSAQTLEAPGATQAVTVEAPTITLNVGGAAVGAGLVYGAYNVSLQTPAGPGGVPITLASSNGGVLQLSATQTAVGQSSIVVTVPQGQSSATYWIQGVEGVTGTAAVTASATGFTGTTSTNVTVRPAIIDLVGLPPNLPTSAADDPFQARVGVANAALTMVETEQAPRAGNPIAVTIANGNAAVAELEFGSGAAQSGSVTIAVGQGRSPATVAAGGVAFDPLGGGTTTVTATSAQTLEATNAAQTVTVDAPTLTANVSGAAVGSGLVYGAYSVSLQTAAPVGGVPVTLTSSDGSVLQLSATESAVGQNSIVVTVPQGQTTASFWIQGVENTTGTATVAASAPGFTGTTSGAVTVRQAMIDIIGLSTTPTTLSPDDPFQVRLGVANSAFTAVQTEQAARAGNPITVTVANGNAAVAELEFSGGAAQTGTVVIPVGQERSPATVAAGGVALDPLGSGTTTVTATSAQTLEATAATQTVTIDAPSITLNVNGARVGSGLVYGTYSVTLEAPAGPGGVPVTLTSSTGSVLQLSATQAAAGQGSIVVTVPQNQSSATFWIQGVEGATGTVTVTATAAGHTNGTASVSVVPAVIDLIGLTATTTAGAVDDAFQVRVGAANVAGTAVQTEQSVRAGNALTVTVTNGTAAVGRLAFAGGPAQSGTVTIAAGQARSPATVAAGGVAFDPLAAGSTAVSATTPGATAGTNATVTVTVNP